MTSDFTLKGYGSSASSPSRRERQSGLSPELMTHEEKKESQFLMVSYLFAIFINYHFINFNFTHEDESYEANILNFSGSC